MVKQRFLTHFKPWLIAVCKTGALIVTYQLLDQIRTWRQHPPLNISDVVTAATIALFALPKFDNLLNSITLPIDSLQSFQASPPALICAPQREERSASAGQALR